MQTYQLDILTKRDSLRQLFRRYFYSKDYLEIETPIAVKCPGSEVNLDFFKTEWVDFQSKKHPLWLRSSPELHMKQALAMGAHRIFQLGKCFRNKNELSYWHHPEFTMLEWYHTHIDFDAFIDDTIEMLCSIGDRFYKSFNFKSRQDLEIPFHFFTVREAFWEFAGIELVEDDPGLASIAIEKGIFSVNSSDDFETAYFKILIEKIEPEFSKLKRVVLYDFLPSQSALSRIIANSAKRFEIYWDGIELCNGFLELLDYEKNKQVFENANRKRVALNKEALEEDLNFFESLKLGIPNCCGNALGFDRFFALLIGSENLDDTFVFERQDPFFKPEY